MQLACEILETRRVLDGTLVQLVNDDVAVFQNSDAVPIAVLANDIFDPAYTGARRITSVSYGNQGGAVEIVEDGRGVTYSPPADFSGREQFVYYLDDQFVASVQIDVQSPLVFDSFEVPPDGRERRLEVLANDPFSPDYTGSRQITSVSVSSAGGTIAISGDRRAIQYTPPEQFHGGDQFVYVVDGRYPSRVTITIPTTLTNDRLEVIQNSHANVLHVLANDPFWPNYPGTKRITHVTGMAEGTIAEISADGRAILYTPAPGASGWNSLTYVVDDTYEANLDVAIHRPVQNDSFTIDRNSAHHLLDVLVNDTYFDLSHTVRHDIIDRVTQVTPPASGGTVRISNNGLSLEYTPPNGFVGSDTFRYMADGLHEAIVTVEVTPPVRNDTFYDQVFQDTPNTLLDVLANDFLGNGYTGARRITAVQGVTEGATVQITTDGRYLRYTPPAHFTGGDAFRYTVDGELEAAVTVAVTPLAQPDHDNFCVDPAAPTRTLFVLANDNFGRGYAGPGVITSAVTSSGGGSVTIASDGRSLRLAPGSSTYQTVTYQVDQLYETTATVWIQGHLVPDAAVANQNGATQSISVLANDFQFSSYTNCPSSHYAGPRRITGVGPTEQGGVVSVATDGRAVQYAPPKDFVGDDRFSYTVDGVMQAEIVVHVVRHVRDDQFRVAAVADGASPPDTLDVLVNDLFAADYQGAQRITSVTSGTSGATIAIAPSRTSLLYQPAAGFVGTDTVHYTVDGTLIASVEIIVSDTSSSLFPQFDSLQNFEQFLIDDALVRYRHLFGNPGYVYQDCPVCDVVEDGVSPGTGPRTETDRDHSETNVQVDGIDEGDIVEFDSDYAYVLNDRGVVIVDAWPAEDLSVVSRIEVDGTPEVEYLHDNRLTIISQSGGGYFFGDMVRGDNLWWPYTPLPTTTYVTVLDVSDPVLPRVVQTTSMEGRYVESRAIGDYVYVVVMNDNAVASPPLLISDEPVEPAGGIRPWVSGNYETEQTYLARIRANTGELIDSALPNYSSYGPDGELARSGLLNAPEDIFRPVTPSVLNLLSVIAFDVTHNEPGLTTTSGVYATGAGTVYASHENFYVFDQGFSSEDGATTQIMQFDWDSATGDVDFVAAGSVPGTMLNQFSADERNGYLRVATSVSNSGAGNWSSRPENTLVVLREDGGLFESVGRLANLALGETIRSVRFLGDQAVVSTFRSVDPLFTLDLSNPQQPRSVGHITLPGYLSYMQRIGVNHLLTVGHNTPDGWNGPTQIALFDISDWRRPRMIDNYTFARFSTSEATVDHHTFGYFAAHGLFALPSSRGYFQRVDKNGDGYRETSEWVQEDALFVFDIDLDVTTDNIQFAGEIEHNGSVRRSGYIGDRLFSIGADAVKSVSVDDPQTVLGSVVITAPGPSVPPTPPTEQLPAARPAILAADAPLRRAMDEAREAVAVDLGVSAGEALIVSAETRRLGGRSGAEIAIRVGERQYLYAVNEALESRLLDSEYTFPTSGASSTWHNPEQPADVNADGHVTWHDIAAIYERLTLEGTEQLGPARVVRQIASVTFSDIHPDVNNDGTVSVLDALAVMPSIFAVARGSTATLTLPDSQQYLDVIAPRTVTERHVGNGVFVTDHITNGQVQLTLMSALAGDADGSGTVDAVDFAAWNSHRFQQGTDWLRGDFDGNGISDGSDFTAWNLHKFRSVAPGSTSTNLRTPRAAASSGATIPASVDGSVALSTRQSDDMLLSQQTAISDIAPREWVFQQMGRRSGNSDRGSNVSWRRHARINAS